jgi:glycine/D-amino acid oxidase-like deaminating enzyme
LPKAPESHSTEKYDVIIVGAGVIGLSSAYHIISQEPSAKVLVIEKALSVGQGDSAKSAAGVRNVFTSEVNRLLADTSIDFYSHLQSDLKIPVNLDLFGYLWLLTSKMFEDISPIIDSLRKSGVALKTWDEKELTGMLSAAKLEVRDDDEEAKMMQLGSIRRGLQGVKAGSIAPEKLVEYYASELERMGVEIRFGERVTSIMVEPTPKLNLPSEPFVWERTNITGVRTSKGEIRSACTILATGSWASGLLDPLGIDCHIRTKKRQIFTFRGPKISSLLKTEGFNDQGVLPMTIIPPCGIYMKPSRADSSLWIGVSDYIGRTFVFEDDPIAEEDFYTHNIYPVISHYFPAFVDARPSNKWAGHYDMNTIDGNPYIFGDSGLVVEAGCSGSGMMKADAIGRIVAAAYSKKDIATLYGGKNFKVSRLGVETRDVEHEDFVI